MPRAGAPSRESLAVKLKEKSGCNKMIGRRGGRSAAALADFSPHGGLLARRGRPEETNDTFIILKTMSASFSDSRRSGKGPPKPVAGTPPGAGHRRHQESAGIDPAVVPDRESSSSARAKKGTKGQKGDIFHFKLRGWPATEVSDRLPTESAHSAFL